MAQASGDLVLLLRSYLDRMLREVPGMKVLLLDQDTTRVVSTVYSQSDVLGREVYLVERLGAEKGDQLLHLKVRAERERGGSALGGPAPGLESPAGPLGGAGAWTVAAPWQAGLRA